MSGYQEYKDSGFKWVGYMPSHWRIVRHKYIFKRVQRIAGERSKEYDVMSLTMKGVIKRDIESNIGKMPASFDGYQIIQPNSLLLCLFDIDVTPRTIGYVTQEGITTAAYTNIETTSNIYLKYYYYWFLMLDMDKTLLHMSKNLRNSIGNSEFMALSTILPTFEEQKKICDFLDSKLNNLDKLIDFKLNLINKLKEKRQLMITEVVTKGLNPNVRMKESAVEWIGEMPEHWSIKKIKYTTYAKGRIGWQGLRADEFTDEGPYLVTGTDFKDGKVQWEKCYHISEERYNEAPEIQLKENDLLITKDGTIGKLALIDYLPDRASLNSHLLVMRPLNNSYLTKFLYWYLTSEVFIKYVEVTKKGTTFYGISQDSIERFKFSCPSIEEQKTIVEYLDRKVSEIDSTINSVKTQIEKLKEYRQSLIYEAVTGKIDVRDFELAEK